MKKDSIIVIGHKNPDTDSICSAISYANLKNKIKPDQDFVACRAGQVNSETEYVLKRFNADIPEYVTDAGNQVKDINMRKTQGVASEYSLKKAWTLMRDLGVSTLPVTDNVDELVGIISIKDLATANMDIFDNTILSTSKTLYKNVVETLEGEIVVGDENTVIEKGKILIAAANPDLLETYVDEGDIVILGNRYDNQLCAIEMGAGCLIICTGSPVTHTITKLAQERGCAIITTPHDTYTAARLINQSTPIRYFMKTKNLITFKTEDFTEEVKQIMGKVRHRDFPVLDNEGKYYGMISRRSLLDLDKKKVILVDHNEKSQAVDGIDNADILEIIDHHRIGSLETMSPVYFRNQPLGCTATIVYLMYGENGVEIEPKIAGLLCAAIISDTLMFRSPTCTAVDKNAAERLAEIAGIDIVSFAEEMFDAGSNLTEKSPEEIFYQDYKKFTADSITFGVGQISSMNSRVFEVIKPKLLSYMEKTFASQGVDMMFFMLTNIVDESTHLIMIGDDAAMYVNKAFKKEVVDNSAILEGVVSRKKQLIPKLMVAMRNE